MNGCATACGNVFGMHGRSPKGNQKNLIRLSVKPDMALHGAEVGWATGG